MEWAVIVLPGCRSPGGKSSKGVRGGTLSGCLSPAHLVASSCQCGNITVCKLAAWAFKKSHCFFPPILLEWCLLCPITHPVALISSYNYQLYHRRWCMCMHGVHICIQKPSHTHRCTNLLTSTSLPAIPLLTNAAQHFRWVFIFFKLPRGLYTLQ